MLCRLSVAFLFNFDVSLKQFVDEVTRGMSILARYHVDLRSQTLKGLDFVRRQTCASSGKLGLNPRGGCAKKRNGPLQTASQEPPNPHAAHICVTPMPEFGIADPSAQFRESGHQGGSRESGSVDGDFTAGAKAPRSARFLDVGQEWILVFDGRDQANTGVRKGFNPGAGPGIGKVRYRSKVLQSILLTGDSNGCSPGASKETGLATHSVRFQ